MIEKVTNVLSAWGMGFLLAAISVAIFNNVVPGFYMHIFAEKMVSLSFLLYVCVVAPIGEEFVFRYIPLTLLRKTDLFEDNKWIFVTILAIVFGYSHGGYFNIFIQGIPGFFFGWVYIKNGMSYPSAVITHSLYNFVLSVVFPNI